MTTQLPISQVLKLAISVQKFIQALEKFQSNAQLHA